jgi:hypothetical protein
MTTTKERIADRSGGVVAPDWVTLSASLKGVASVQGLNSDGEFFIHEQTVEARIDLLEYVETGSHTHQEGGDSMEIISVARHFYQEEKVKSVFVQANGQDLFIYLVLEEEFEDMGLKLASLQNAIQKANEDVYFEIDYSVEDETHLDALKTDYKEVSRR